MLGEGKKMLWLPQLRLPASRCFKVARPVVCVAEPPVKKDSLQGRFFLGYERGRSRAADLVYDVKIEKGVRGCWYVSSRSR